jgi:hypothetical protein
MALPISLPYPPMEALSSQNGRLSLPRLLRWRPDKVPKACSMMQVKSNAQAVLPKVE